MDQVFPLVKIGEVAKPIDRVEVVRPEWIYRQIGVRLWGNGAYERESMEGSQTRYKTLSRVEADDIVVNKIWARNGSVAVVSSELAGCYGSGEFPTFNPNRDRLYPRWFHWITKTKFFWSACDEKSQGTSGKNRIRPERFLEIEIPLPPLAEQRRIVGRIEALAGKVEEARRLRETAVAETEAIISSALHQIFEVDSEHWNAIPMTEAIEITAKQVDPTLPEYLQLPHINGANIESKTCRLLPYQTIEEDGMTSNKYLFSPNTVLYSKIRPYLQKATFVDFEGLCSADIYPIEVINEDIDSKFLMWSLVAGPFSNYANRLSGRTRMPKLNRKQLFDFELPYPSSMEQQNIVSYLEELRRRLDDLRRLQAMTQQELDALMPSILDKAFKGQL